MPLRHSLLSVNSDNKGRVISEGIETVTLSGSVFRETVPAVGRPSTCTTPRSHRDGLLYFGIAPLMPRT
jgi:hypothetical protein